MTKQRYRNWLCATLVFLSSYPVFGQSSAQTRFDSGWSLINSEGDLILTRDGRRTVYQNGSSKPQGVLLGAKDMVQTGKGAAELRLISGISSADMVIKLSENTSVILNEFSSEVSLDLLYGRLQILSTFPLTVKTGNFSSVFRACEASLEYVARPGYPQPALMISCYKGEGELLINPSSETGAARFAIKNAEYLSLEYRMPFYYVERKSLELPSVQSQETAAAESESRPVAAETTTSSDISFLDVSRGPQYTTQAGKDKTARIKTGNAIMGLLFMSAGAAMQGYTFFASPDKELSDLLFYGAYGPFALGAAFLLGAAAYRAPSGK